MFGVVVIAIRAILRNDSYEACAIVFVFHLRRRIDVISTGSVYHIGSLCVEGTRRN